MMGLRQNYNHSCAPGKWWTRLWRNNDRLSKMTNHRNDQLKKMTNFQTWPTIRACFFSARCDGGCDKDTVKDRTMMSRSRLTEAVSIFPSDDSFKAILQYFLELGIILFQGQNVIKSSQASRKLCELLEPGLGAIFGPTSPSAANHVQSVSQALHVPFVETRWRLDWKRSCIKTTWRWEYDLVAAAYSINIHPHPRYLGQALADFVQKVESFCWLQRWVSDCF